MPAPSHAVDTTERPQEEVSLWTIATAVVRRPQVVLLTPIVVVLAMTLPVFLQGRTYTSMASFTSAGRRSASPISGLAAQFGVSVPPTDGGQSPSFYVDLARSSTILRAVAAQPLDVRTDTGRARGSLAAMWNIQAGTPAEREELVVRRLRGVVHASVAQKSGVVTVEVRTQYPDLSLHIATNLLDQIHAFNLASRQSIAAAERRFTQSRLVEAQQELRGSENRLQDFMLRNRDYRSSPDLVLEYDRRMREVVMHQQLYTTLAQALDQAQIEEVRNTPVIQVVERPVRAAFPDGRGIMRRATLGGFAGVFLGVVLAVIAQLVQRLQNGANPEFSEFQDALRSLSPRRWKARRRTSAS